MPQAIWAKGAPKPLVRLLSVVELTLISRSIEIALQGNIQHRKMSTYSTFNIPPSRCLRGNAVIGVKPEDIKGHCFIADLLHFRICLHHSIFHRPIVD